MSLSFNKSHIVGFGPIADQEFDWGVPGLNIMKAPNGYGKTKFINSLFWGLYGKSLSGSIDTWEHVRSKDHHGTMVEINFSNKGKDYKIIRCRDYTKKILGAKGGNRLIFIGAGDQKTKKTDIQKGIDEALGYSPELFKNSIIFGQKLKRLIAETGPNKKKVLEEAFEMVFIAEGRKISTQELSRLKDLKIPLQIKVEGLNSKVENKEVLIKSEEKSSDEFEVNREIDKEKKVGVINKTIAQLDELELKIKENKGTQSLAGLREELGEVNSEINGFPPTLGRDKNDLVYKKQELVIKNKSLEKTNQELTQQLEDIPNICFNCKKPYTPSEVKEEGLRIKQSIDKNDKIIKQNKVAIKEIETKLVGIENKLSSKESKETNRKQLEKKISALESKLILTQEWEKQKKEKHNSLVELRDELKELENKTHKNNLPNLRKELKELKTERRPNRIKLRRLNKQIEVYDWIIKDPLSNSGLKAFIFNDLLDKINDRLYYYQRYVNFRVYFSINMDSHHKDLEVYVFQGEYPVPYEDLSGGQQQAVDIASAFAIHDVVSGNKVCDLLVMDELFESLDKNNIEILTELILDKSKDKCLYLVTHRNEFNPTNTRTIEITFTNGITRVRS